MDLNQNHPLMQNLKSFIDTANLSDVDQSFVNKAFIDVYDNLKQRKFGTHMSIIFPPLHNYYRYLLSVVAQLFSLYMVELKNGGTDIYSVLSTQFYSENDQLPEIIANIAQENAVQYLPIAITEETQPRLDQTTYIEESMYPTTYTRKRNALTPRLETILEENEEEYWSEKDNPESQPSDLNLSTLAQTHTTNQINDNTLNTNNQQANIECTNINTSGLSTYPTSTDTENVTKIMRDLNINDVSTGQTNEKKSSDHAIIAAEKLNRNDATRSYDESNN